MKLNYFKYAIEANGNRYQNSLFNILHKCALINNPAFRSSFVTQTGDNLFLFHIRGRIFLLAITKDDEIIKAINRNSLNHENIYTRLQGGEQLGFSSYIYVGDSYYGIASTFHGPKNGYWTHFISELFNKLGLSEYNVIYEAFPVNISRNDALSLDYKGSTYFQINSRNPYYSQFLGMLGLIDEANQDASTIEITIKPRPRNQMPNTFNHVLASLPEEGLEKYIVKAKENLEDLVSDFYIVGTGHISDFVRGTTESEICGAIENCISRNRSLLEAINEYTSDTNYIRDTLPRIAHYSDDSNWVGLLRNNWTS